MSFHAEFDKNASSKMEGHNVFAILVEVAFTELAFFVRLLRWAHFLFCKNNIYQGENIMNLTEYQTIKNLNYLEYCDYLQEKYGIGLCDYMTRSWNKNPGVTRTKEGLLAHHKYEDRAIMLSTKEYAMNNPYEWQLAKNIVYCDYLEHLLLHILICENPSKDRNPHEAVGIGGVINHLVPELNDFYSGWQTNQPWRKTCHNLIKKDKDVYMVLLKRFKENCKNYPLYTEGCLYSSLNARFGLWSEKNNSKIYYEISKL